ncbi:Phosphate-binding protein PstS [Baekduia alba]|uniref:phosphate ABC transporter substrate-binding protein PstS n=1 Tax=Baekduia alba TaxID=2997333 RepID=UPI00234146A7|nr:phosphate ABC transporter substrate-binding protein PstS [Baekduia alba]WCB92908.1 Phosphate-binding protein PstS [Baekduia alba]
MKSRILPAAFAAAALATGLAACGSSDDDSSTNSSASGSDAQAAVTATLNGAGSTFAAPIYQQVGSDLKGKGLTINYQGVGSGAGVSQFAAGTVDFAGSDPALTDDDTASIKKGEPVQIPFALGAITASYKLGGVDSGLKLDGSTLANIYLGKITSWDDAAIKGQNPDVQLPSTKITVVHRSDSSGTTKGFTQFLANYSPAWKSGPGVDKDIKWPTGTGAKGNDGVAAAVKQTDGAIGYVEQAYALQNGFTFADVKNKSGKYIAPTLESTSAAAEGIEIPADLGVSTIDAPGASAYPIVSQTFAIAYKDACKAGLDKNKATGLKTFFNYLINDGQDTIKKLSYAPIPDSLKTKDQAAVDAMQCNGAAITS